MSVALDVCAASRRALNHDPNLAAGLLLVPAIVRQLRISYGRVLPKDDMVGLANEGLVDALTRFEPARGVEFKVYAARRIRGAVIDGMRRESMMGRRAWTRAWAELGVSPFESDAVEEVAEDDGDAPSIEELMIRSAPDCSPPLEAVPWCNVIGNSTKPASSGSLLLDTIPDHPEKAISRAIR